MKGKKLVILLVVAMMSLWIIGNVFAGYVRGYYRSDGTYVRPHYRSNPDGIKWNNYGSPSSSQRRQYKDYHVLPSYNYDYDDDGISNQYDFDDDNDSLFDDWE